MSAGHVHLDLVPIKGTPFTIRYADELAEFFFRTNGSAVGPNSYDAWIAAGKDPDRITVDDLRAVNATMGARTSHKRWVLFTDGIGTFPELAAIGRGWDLLEMTDEQWRQNHVEELLGALLRRVMGPYRGAAVVTKVLHIKRPALIPVCDSLVAGSMGASCEDVNDWQSPLELIVHLRAQGRANLDGLRGVRRRLGLLDPPIHRTSLRILDALLWMRGLKDGPYPVFREWLERVHR